MAKIQDLSLRVQWLGERLKKARTARGYTLQNAADYLELTEASLSRFERGTMRVRKAYLKELIDFYGISNRRDRDTLMQLNEDAWRKDWWDGETDDMEMEFLDYTWLESRASKISIYEPILMTGLLQTEDYVDALMFTAHGGKTESKDIRRLVELRMARQRILEKEEPTALSVVFEESVLRRPIGGTQVLKGQLAHLLAMASKPTIEILVLPTSIGWHPGEKGPFTFFEMRDPYPDVAYTESLTSRVFLEEEAKVTRYQQAYADLHRTALNASESKKLIRAHIKDVE